MSLSHRVTLNDLTNEGDRVFASPSLTQWKKFSATPNCKTPLKRVRSESIGRSRIARNIRHYENLSSLSNTPVRAGQLDDMMDRTGASSLFSSAERASLANENVPTTKIKVFVRVRPSSSTKKCIQISDDERHISVRQHQGSANKELDFSCESIFSEESNQQDVYEKMGQEMLNKFLNGTNICIFAYGQTGSGKTHSILGNSSEPGLLPRFCTELFSSNHIIKENVENTGDTNGSLFSIKVSFYELYLEKVYDLLAQTRAPLRIRGAESAYLENLSEFEVFSQAELEEVLYSGLTRRATATTLVNDLSSRSHAIFQIILEKTNREMVDNIKKESVVQSKCYFVDLAGSERLHMTTGYENRAVRDLSYQLLSVSPAKVIESKSSCSTSAFVNYRESVLTRLLKECFGGNSLTSLLATVSPEQQYSQLSIGTLRFASKAALVDQTARQNVDPFVMAVKGLKAQNNEMKAELERLRSDYANNSVRSTIGSVPYKGMQGPCVLELLADATLNRCTYISNNKGSALEFSSAAEDRPSVSFVLVETERIRLDVLGDHVAVNGQLMQQGVQLVLNHGDRIVLAGTRFFVFLNVSNPSLEEVPSFERVKLEFVEGTFPIVERKLIEQARLEFETDKQEMMRKVNQELEVARRELEDLKQANLKKTTRNVSMVTETVESQEEDLNKMCSEMEESIKETEEVKEKLEKITDSSNQTNLFSTFDNLSCEEKEDLLRLKACISTANNILERFDKRSLFLFKLVSNSASDIERVSVRLINLKSRVFADLLANDFIVQIYEKLVEIYQESASSSDGMAQVEAILYSGTWQWRKGVAGRRSNIFTTALFNSMKDTARMRQSSRCDSQTSLRSRRSVISEVLDMAKDNGEKNDTTPRATSIAQKNVDEDYSDFELCRNLLRACLELDYKMDLAVASTSQFFQDGTAVVIEQQDAENTSFSSVASSEIDANTPIFLVHWFVQSVSAFRLVVRCLERSTATDHIITEMNSVVTLVFNDKTRWVMALAEKSESSKFFIRNINNHLKLMQTLIGRLAFLVNEPFPEDEVFEKAEQSFQIGVLQSIDEVCEDVLDVYKAFQNNSTPRAHIITILCKCIKDVHQELTCNTYNATLAFDVLRPLVYYKNKLSQNQADWTMLLEKFQFMVEQIDEIYELQEGEHLAIHLKASLQACINIIEAVVNKPTKKIN